MHQTDYHVCDSENVVVISLTVRRKQPRGVTKVSKLLRAGQDEEVWRVVVKGEAVVMADRLTWVEKSSHTHFMKADCPSY